MYRRIVRTEEPGRLIIADRQLMFTLKRSSARRSVALHIDHRGLTVYAPLRLSDVHWERFLIDRADWVFRHLDLHRHAVMDWREGATVYWLGRRLSLMTDPRPGCRVVANALRVGETAPAKIEKAVIDWYRRIALPYLSERLDLHAARLGIATPCLRLSNARGRWGSCSPSGTIRLNWRLIQAAPEEIDYVICHELAHLRHMDHSPAFWRLVGRLFPGYDRVRAALREKSTLYFAI